MSVLKRAAVAVCVVFCACNQGVGAEAPGSDAAIKHVAPLEASKLIKEKKVMVLDIRTPGEFKAGRITGATNIDFLAADFQDRLNTLDKSKAYLVHCASGGRSTRSLAVFKKQQFQSVYHLDGGLKAWEKAGLPVQK